METTEAIVLRRIPFGDSSLVLHLFAPDRGRVPALAKGAFRSKSPHFASLDLLNRIRAPILRRREGGLALLGPTELLDEHRRLRARLPAIAAGLFAAELIDAALTESPAPALYAHLATLLARLDAPDGPRRTGVAEALLAFELAFLDDLGLRPELDRCAECGAAEERWTRCSASAGGVLCARCAPAARDAVRTSPGALDAARSILAGAEVATLRPAEALELRALLDRFHAYHLDRVPRSRLSLERAGALAPLP